jgi:hypothetical protein
MILLFTYALWRRITLGFWGLLDKRTFLFLCLAGRCMALNALRVVSLFVAWCAPGARIVTVVTSGLFCFLPLIRPLHTNRRYDLHPPVAENGGRECRTILVNHTAY